MEVMPKIAKPIPMKRELKHMEDGPCEAFFNNCIAKPIPMKRELKPSIMSQ